MKNGKSSMLKLAGVLVIIFILYRLISTSGYMPISITSESDYDYDTYHNSVLGLNYSPSCNPGSADQVDPATGTRKVMSSYYTPGLLPGGYCDDQVAINKLMNYKINPTNIPLGD